MLLRTVQLLVLSSPLVGCIALGCRRETSHASDTSAAPTVAPAEPAARVPGAEKRPAATMPPASGETTDAGPATTSTAAAEPTAPSARAVPSCTVDATFAGILPVAEASAATEAELTPGTRELVVVSDSGRKGQAIAYALPGGPSRDLVLPLDPAASDDTEGLAWRDGHLYALTSSGFVLAMTPDGRGGLKRSVPAYPIGPPPFVCDDAVDGNCGKNYEGLCLRAGATAGSARCAGYAASRTEGALYCLTFAGASDGGSERLEVDQVHPALVLPVPRDSLSDCAFGSGDGPAGAVLLVSTNLHGGSHVYVVDEASGGIQPIDVPGILNDEAIAVDHTGALYQAMDDNGTPSPAVRAQCRW